MQALNRVLQALSKAIYKVFFIFATITFSVLLIILLVNVISRNLLTGSIAEIEEVSRYIFTWAMFMGIAIGVYHKKHLGVDFIMERYPYKLRRIVTLISDLLTLLLFLMLTIYGFRYSSSTMRMYSPILSIPYGVVYLCVPLCGVFSLFYTLSRLVDDFCNKEEKGGD